MDKLREEFNYLIKGSNILYEWKSSIERDFNNGCRINKTKYNKIDNMYKDRRKQARNLLSVINRNSNFMTCMTPDFIPSNRPPKQNRKGGLV